MTDHNMWIASRARVPIRAGETIQIINSHDEEVRRISEETVEALAVDLAQFSNNMTAGLPTFLPAKPHRAGLCDNDNTPAR